MDKLSLETAGPKWKGLYIIAGAAALISAALIPVTIIAFFVWPLFPGPAVEIFTLIQNDRLAGLMSLDFMYLLGNFVTFPIFLALYVTLRRTSESFALIALVLGLVGFVSIITARPILEMLSLSDQYAAATTEARRSELLAAGEAVLTLFHGTAFNVHYILGSASLLISALLMLRSEIYSKSTAYVGVITNIAVFGLYVPRIGVYISLLSVVGYLIWNLLIARRLFQLGQDLS